MRAAFLVALAIATAGCVAEAPSAADDAAPEGQGGEAASPTNAAPDVPAAAREPVEIRHDYSAAAETVEFEVVEGAYDVRIGFSAPESVMGCVSPDARIVVTSADGEVYADLAPSAVQTPCDGTQGAKIAKEILVGGTWTAEFTGSGVAVAVIELSPL